MEDLNRDFETLAERADDYGALWALRTLYRIVSAGEVVRAEWPGTIEQARHLVGAFADRVGIAERETLAGIVQDTAALTWSDSIGKMEQSH